MSLFENSEYQWRETYFIMFREGKQPDATTVQKTLQKLDPRYVIRDVRADEAGQLESLTLESPDDYSAMDVSLVRGDEVAEQTADLIKELLEVAETKSEKQAIQKLAEYQCRYDVYHFEQLVFVGRSEDDDADDFMDPGSVLIVMEKLAQACDGVVIDPQANAIL